MELSESPVNFEIMAGKSFRPVEQKGLVKWGFMVIMGGDGDRMQFGRLTNAHSVKNAAF